MGRFTVESGLLKAAGELETEDLEAFDEAAEVAIATAEGELVLDFTEVTYMPSSFVGGLMSLRSRLAGEGRGLVLKASPVVRQLLDLTGMTSSITLAD